MKQRDVPSRSTQAKADNKLPVRRPSATLTKAWRSALNVTEVDVAAYAPAELDCKVAEAFLAGQITMGALAEFTGASPAEVTAVVTNPVAMAWISRAVAAHYKHLAGIVDAAVYQRALTGDVAAAKLFYERVGATSQDRNVNVRVSGGYDVRSLSDDDLRALLQDANKKLPPIKVVDAEFKEVAPPEGPAHE